MKKTHFSKNLINKFRQKRIKPGGWLIVGVAFFYWGCASQPGIKKSGRSDIVAEPMIRVALAGPPAIHKLSFDGSYTLTLAEATYSFDATIGELEVLSQDGGLTLRGKRRYFNLPSPQLLVFKPFSPDQKFKWDEFAYSGELTLHFVNGEILAVNKLPIETYLMGVIPREIPTTQEEFKEAVYAQAIAARSYALSRLDKPRDARFDLWSDERDQVYNGVSKTPVLAKEAIINTRGNILTRNGQPALASYHASSGGVLEVNAPDDSTSGRALRKPRLDTIDGESNDKVSPYYRWVEARSSEAILQNLVREFGLDPNTAQHWIESGYTLNIDINQRTPGGRVKSMTVQIGDDSFLVEGIKIRRILADPSGKPIPSNLFFLNVSPSNPDKFYIVGAGAGHGNGMSQWGAIGMALKGRTYKNILAFYYPNFELRKFY